LNILAETIHAKWCELLVGAKGEPDENFFDHGGTSLQAAVLVTDLRAQGVDVPLAAVFEDGRLGTIINKAREIK